MYNCIYSTAFEFISTCSFLAKLAHFGQWTHQSRTVHWAFEINSMNVLWSSKRFLAICCPSQFKRGTFLCWHLSWKILCGQWRRKFTRGSFSCKAYDTHPMLSQKSLLLQTSCLLKTRDACHIMHSSAKSNFYSQCPVFRSHIDLCQILTFFGACI